MPSTQKKLQFQDNVRGSGKVPVTLNVNGSSYTLEIEPRRTLLDALRFDLNMTGSKKVCGMGECGACTVLLDGKAIYSCLTLAVECEGNIILTIEGLAQGQNLDPIQKAFVDEEAFQCGFCTSGQIMSVKALLDTNPDPTPEEIRRAMSGNICRCGAYPNIFKAATKAAAAYRKQRPAKKNGGKHGETD
jgi:aerobic-type carbon monoxide dehydrogenase small subunit (CoxS/CutS family)